MHRYITIRGAALIVLAAIAILFGGLASHSDALPAWVSPDSPSLIKQYSQGLAESLPTTVGGLGNRDCETENVVTRPSRILQSQLSTSGCFIRTNFGTIESSWLMRFNGAGVAGQYINHPNYSSGLIAIPNSSNVMQFSSAAPSGVHLHLTRAIPAPIKIEKSPTGEVTYRFIQPADVSLRDTNGTLMAAQTDSLSFSSNGRWAVVDLPNRAMVRINTETFEVLPFMNAFSYNGDSPSAQTAVSNDGRYALVSSRSYSLFRIFDLSTCADIPANITRSATCESRDLLPFIKSQFEGYLASTHLRFTSNNIIELFVASNNGSGVLRTRSTLLAPGQIQTKVNYLGMGDSFSSGEGDMQGLTYYEPGTNETQNKCHLSQRSYPYLLRNALTIENFHSIACSGAVIRNVSGTLENDRQYKDSPLPMGLGSWTPGYQRQLGYFTQGANPDFLTISVGGNDVGFADAITECVTSHYRIPIPNSCRYASDQTERGNVIKRIADQYFPLKKLYEEIVRTTNKRTRVYVVGYPQFIKGEGGSCGLNVHLNDQERYFVSQSTSYMNRVIKAASEAAGVYYLDIENALEGKNLSSIVPDNQMGVNGLTEGDDQTLPWWMSYATPGNVLGVVAARTLGIGNESFHPNSNGHIYMKEKILGLTGGDPGSHIVCPSQPSSVVCPKGDGKVPLPDAAYFGMDAVNYANNRNTPVSIFSADPPRPIALVAEDGSPAMGQVQVYLEYLLPGSTVTFTDRSSSTNLGAYIADSKGTLSVILPIPQGTVAGIHTLHAQVTDIAGEQQTYYEPIFIPGAAGDVNGNGTPDEQETCGFVQLSGVDTDQDNVDDACDGEIAPPLPQLTLSIDSLRVVPFFPN